MPTISRITTQKKNKHRFNIFITKDGNESYGFSVAEDTLIAEHLHKGMEIDQETMDALIKKDNLHKGYSLALHFLSHRMRSTKEMYDYLVKKELDDEQIRVIIARLVKEKWLDDRLFAEAFVRTKIETTSKGPLLIKKELMEKGVSAVEAEAGLRNYTFDKQVEKISKLIIKKQNQRSKASHKQQINKVKQSLLQKGFTQDAISDAFSNNSHDKDEENEWDAVVYQGEKILRKHQRKWTGFELEQKVKASLYQKGFAFDDIEKFIDIYIKNEDDSGTKE
ncbi:regulatory protein RecX [Paraliobacillus ryukyuensis]|uniref:Regulatory protein RecX n=1 Tax=Paraliobacillus ryukyuensis TaxID=200904 RepID=A0A366DZ84_9BACI|nr:recombination regulator RecX [Paraliobacillus ryukyuensis]RBO95421.1 regulatory protein [Paraliobacillus ryukyuensis]